MVMHRARPLSSSCRGHTHTRTTAGTRTQAHKNMGTNSGHTVERRWTGGGTFPPPNPPPCERVVMNVRVSSAKALTGHQARSSLSSSCCGHTHTHTTAGTWTRATHTTHTCHTSQWASIPHRRDAASMCWVSLDGAARVNGYIKNGTYPGAI